MTTWAPSSNATTACCSVATGEAALQVMEKEDVELMLLDVRLPGISGFEVLKIARENYPYVEVIIIVGRERPRRRHRGDALRRLPLHLQGLRPRGRSARLVANASERQDLEPRRGAAARGSRPNRSTASSSSVRADGPARSSSWCSRWRSCRPRC